jgi:diketogulonate reductase-like aldo/keto reductase
MATVPTVRLNNGVEIPQLGFGVFQVKPEECVQAVRAALEIGYRHIDTAEMYGNEKEVGQAIRESGIDPSEVFVTSKLNNGYHARDDALKAFDQTMDDLGLERLDLFLVHWPLPGIGVDYVETWQAMTEIYASGRCRAIGVSNFHEHHLHRIFEASEIKPAVNQIEISPYLTQDPLRAFCREHEIAVEAWSPIARGKVNEDPAIKQVADTVGRTPAQVTLRWHVQRGDIVFPKSVNRGRMEENFAIFDFELDESAMAALSGLDRGERTGPNPDEFNHIP